MNRLITRRQFLMGMGGSLLGFQWPQPISITTGNRYSITKPLRLIFMTDVHARTQWPSDQAADLAEQALVWAAEAINAQQPDLVIAGGDLITEGFTSSPAQTATRWEAYLRLQDAIKAPVYPVLGNHDLVGVNPKDGSNPVANPRSEFLNRTGLKRSYYSFDFGGYHFVVLDSVGITPDAKHYEGRVSKEQLEWLRNDLADLKPETPIIAATHIPLVPPDYRQAPGKATLPPDQVVQNNRQVLSILGQRNLILILQGHLHVYDHQRWHTSIVTGGAICGGWWQGSWKGTPEGFSLITLNGNQAEAKYLEYWRGEKRPGNL